MAVDVMDKMPRMKIYTWPKEDGYGRVTGQIFNTDTAKHPVDKHPVLLYSSEDIPLPTMEWWLEPGFPTVAVNPDPDGTFILDATNPNALFYRVYQVALDFEPEDVNDTPELIEYWLTKTEMR